MLTHLLVDTLIASAPSRIVTVSSDAYKYGEMKFPDLMYSDDESHGMGLQAYSDSKLANVLFSKELARKLKGWHKISCKGHSSVFNKLEQAKGLKALIIVLF